MNRREFRPAIEQCERRDLMSILAGSHFIGTEVPRRGGGWFVTDTGSLVVNGVSQGIVALTGVVVPEADGLYKFDWSVQSKNLLTQSVYAGPLTGLNLQVIDTGPGTNSEFYSQYIPNAGNTTNTLNLQ